MAEVGAVPAATVRQPRFGGAAWVTSPYAPHGQWLARPIPILLAIHWLAASSSWSTPKEAIESDSSAPVDPHPEGSRTISLMRNEYQLKDGSPNPYVTKLGAKGRADLVQWWLTVTSSVRVLPPDVAEEFPDTKNTVEALRLVIKLRATRPTGRAKASRAKRRSP
jgi:hypothetical protein